MGTITKRLAGMPDHNFWDGTIADQTYTADTSTGRTMTLRTLGHRPEYDWIAQFGDIYQRSPRVDVRAYDASGSEEATTGGITTGTYQLTLAAIKDFRNGQGIKVAGAGAAGVDLVTTIGSGEGTLILTLDDAASTTVAAANVYHDDTAAIQAAIAAADGKTVYLPGGYTFLISPIATVDTYVVCLQLELGSRIVGDGAGSVLKLSPSAGVYDSMIYLSSAKVTAESAETSLRDFQLDWNSDNNASAPTAANGYRGMQLYPGAATTLDIRNLILQGYNGRHGILAIASAYLEAASVHNCKFLDAGNKNDQILGSRDDSAIYLHVKENGLINVSNNLFEDAYYSSATCVTAIETHGGTQTISNNTIFGFRFGIMSTGVSDKQTRSISITGNSIDRASDAIYVWTETYSGGATPEDEAMTDVNISGNSVTISRARHTTFWGDASTGWSGILCNSSFASGEKDLDKILISNNTLSVLDASGTYGTNYQPLIRLYINDVGQPAEELKRIVIKGNALFNAVATGILVAPLQSYDIKFLDISNNVIHNPANGAAAGSAMAGAYQSGIVIAADTINMGVIKGNTIFDDRATGLMDYGIYIAATAAATVEHLIIEDNHVRWLDDHANQTPIFVDSDIAGGAWLRHSHPFSVLPTALSIHCATGSIVKDTETLMSKYKYDGTSATAWHQAGDIPRVVAVTQAASPYTVTAAQAGTMFTNELATGAVEFRLPDISANNLLGQSYTFMVYVNQNITVTCNANGDGFSYGDGDNNAYDDIDYDDGDNELTAMITIRAIGEGAAKSRWVITQKIGTWTLGDVL